MSVVKILSKSVNYLERSIIYEVDGEKKLISAPLSVKTFEELEAEIRAKYGGDTTEKKTEKVETPKESTAPVKVETKPSTKKNAKTSTSKGSATE